MGDVRDEEEDHVKGGKEMMKQAEAGMALFKKDDVEAEGDVDAATKFKDEADAKIKALEAEAEALTGKDNKKARTDKSKEASAVKTTKEYIDAALILKGKPPKNGNFVKENKEAEAAKKKAKEEEEAAAKAKAEAEAAAAAAEEAKKAGGDKKPAKKVESAGISPGERAELESLKTQIIDKKKALKESGMSGGAMNKDEEIVVWVTRMNELKEKENPGALAAGKKDGKKDTKKKKLSGEAAAALETAEKELEDYRNRLLTEFKYTKKEINADPDFVEMSAKLKELQKGK